MGHPVSSILLVLLLKLIKHARNNVSKINISLKLVDFELGHSV